MRGSFSSDMKELWTNHSILILIGMKGRVENLARVLAVGVYIDQVYMHVRGIWALILRN